jgi:hypothetical protein
MGKGYQPGISKSKAKTVVVLDLDKPADDQPVAAAATNASQTAFQAASAEESEIHGQLIKKLTACVDCPHTKGTWCLKTPGGAHVRFDAQRIGGWVKALVRDMCFLTR